MEMSCCQKSSVKLSDTVQHRKRHRTKLDAVIDQAFFTHAACLCVALARACAQAGADRWLAARQARALGVVAGTGCAPNLTFTLDNAILWHDADRGQPADSFPRTPRLHTLSSDRRATGGNCMGEQEHTVRCLRETDRSPRRGSRHYDSQLAGDEIVI